MITEQDQENQSRKKIESGIRLCEEAMAKAEKYERLQDNKDFKGFLEDLNILVGLHEREIAMGVSSLPDAPATGYMRTDDFGKQQLVSSKADWADFISRHEIQKKELLNWIQEPERILKMASLAREKLPLLKDKLSEMKLKENPNASGN